MDNKNSNWIKTKGNCCIQHQEVCTTSFGNINNVGIAAVAIVPVALSTSGLIPKYPAELL
jgi:hypothetical protein